MKHHQYIPRFRFVKEPVEFNKYTDRDLLQYCLGATLYMPGTKNVTSKILRKEMPGLTSMVMCFEDAIQEQDLSEAETNVVNHLGVVSQALGTGAITLNDIPLTFLRARSPEQFRRFASKLTPAQAEVLTGFVFPKFDTVNGFEYFRCLEALNRDLGVTLYGMPILEGRLIAFDETRSRELDGIRKLLAAYRSLVLNIRVGATDFSSIFGVRRGINYSIYDILTVRDCLSDILTCFTRTGEDYVLSAPVWEYFLADMKDSIDHLLQENIHRSLLQRSPIINDAIDGLLREVILDKANGFVGKTIIHPSHTRYVNAMQAVTREEYEDALQILDTPGGVVKSNTANKMNEINPHRSWAAKTARRAEAYGVVENEDSYLRMISH